MKFIYLVLFNIACAYGNFYEKLNISKDATDREIRQAFRKKVLVMHPDKNLDDPNAEDNFIKLKYAYDVLKDENLRKKYDLYGEEGLENKHSQNGNFHSWSYYHDNFGIYDDDYPDIITLSKTDFEQSVVGSVVWFVNFYHPMCSHCHKLAPLWREIARELSGVVRFGAVNCDDAFQLCNDQMLRNYPTIIIYPERKVFQGYKSKENMLSFALKHLGQDGHFILHDKSWRTVINKCDKPWLVLAKSMHFDDSNHRQLKISAIFGKILCISEVDCERNEEFCSVLGVNDGYAYFGSSEAIRESEGTVITGADTQEMVKKIWSLVPNLPVISQEALQKIIEDLKMKRRTTHLLVIFVEDDLEHEMKKLPSLVPGVEVKRIKCSDAKNVCDGLFISKIPAFALFKPLGGYEMHQGRQLVDDVAAFVWEGVKSEKYQMLTPNEFPEILEAGRPWFIEFYSPMCPPCLKMLPQFRKASRLVELNINFGSIDCISHKSTCEQYNIRSYPTTILYNGSTIYEYRGISAAQNIAQFVSDTLHSLVIILDEGSFREKILNKPAGETWVVDYFAAWCQHCLEMAPEYKKLARLVQNMKDVKIASIDCAVYTHVCREQGLPGYPTIRLYPSQSVGISSSLQYQGWARDAESFRSWIVSSFPSIVKQLNDESFENVLRSSEMWLVYFYAPWCQPCQRYAPMFEEVAKKLTKVSRAGKVNCDHYDWICKAAGVNSFPLVKLYWGTSGPRQSPYGYTLNTLDVHEVVSFVKSQSRSKHLPSHDEF